MEKGEEGVSSLFVGKRRLPLLFGIPDYSSSERSILDISTKEFSIIRNPSFQDSRCVFTKGGWMLMRKEDRQDGHTLFLLNPVVGHIIDLPRIEGFRQGLFTFSLVAGIPDRIIHVEVESASYGCVCIRETRIGHDDWEVHSVINNKHFAISSVALVGSQVICIDYSRGFIAFDLAERNGSVASRPQPLLGGLRYISEFEGEVAKIYCPHPTFSSFNFTKLDRRRMECVVIDDAKLENGSWFLGRPWSFYARDDGKKVYNLIPNSYDGDNPPVLRPGQRRRVIRGREIGSDMRCNVYVHDGLENDTTRPLLTDAFLTKEVKWVDVDFLG